MFDPEYDYEYTFNPLFFFDNTLTQGTMSNPTAGGTGLFKIYNWPLSANGGLSTVYMKAILEGPNGSDIEYPMGYGVFDEIIWEGEIPVNPDFPEIAKLHIQTVLVSMCQPTCYYQNDCRGHAIISCVWEFEGFVVCTIPQKGPIPILRSRHLVNHPVPPGIPKYANWNGSMVQIIFS